MVRIIDGEIVADDDPRLRGGAARRPASGHQVVGGGGGAAASGTSGGAAAGGSVFDWNAPPLRVVPDTTGTNLGGLPGVTVYGAHIPPQHILMLAGLLLVFGWKGGLAGAALWYWMQSSQPRGGGGGAQRAGGGNQSDRLAAAQDYFGRMFQQPPLGRGGPASRAAAGGMPGAAPERPTANAADPWAAKGRPRRLNDPQ